MDRPGTDCPTASKMELMDAPMSNEPTVKIEEDTDMSNAFVDAPPQDGDSENPQLANTSLPTDNSHVGARSERTSRRLSIQELIAHPNIERLEAGVAEGLKILGILEKPLKDLEGTLIAEELTTQIRGCGDGAADVRTIIGVMGNTGSGKSSLLNALLDMEKIVPTSGMRACTSVVTEISYNYSDSSSKYFAQIDFIQAEEWEKELKVLRDEIIDPLDGTISKDILRTNSEAAAAYSKIRAVYPNLDNAALVSMSTDELMSLVVSRNVLGTSRHVKDRDSKVFYSRVKLYVDGKSKSSKRGKKASRREFEYWPLIKVVKIYLKADVLSTGAVLVDLPGVQDSNAARSAVAEQYIKNCSGLWIVAPITRAVDDKVAKNLLGDAFKEQIRFDGSYSSITFICSKTDDFSLSEAQESLDLGAEFDELEQRMESLNALSPDFLKEMKEIKEESSKCIRDIEELEDEIETWEALERNVDEEETAYATDESPLKRKRPQSPATPIKRLHQDVAGFDAAVPRPEPGVLGKLSVAPDATEVDARLTDLRREKMERRRYRRQLLEHLSSLEERLQETNKELGDILAYQTVLGIKCRNEFSRNTIQQEFAAGIREADQSAAFDHEADDDGEDEDDHDAPDNSVYDTRNYNEIADNLPVFCVSSRAYQKLSKRLVKDNKLTGFFEKAQTEIPQLQSHCHRLTEKTRQAHCRKSLNNIQLLLNSLDLWASSILPSEAVPAQKREEEKQLLLTRLQDLELSLNEVVADSLSKISDILMTLTSKFGRAAKSSAKRAVPTAEGWGDRNTSGGLHYQTYHATVRRDGAFQGKSGARDFNRELLEPMSKRIAPRWDTAFNNQMLSAIAEFGQTASNIIKASFAAIERLGEEQCSQAGIRMLVDSLKGLDSFQEAADTINSHVNKRQKDINRDFIPKITSAMQPVYATCAAERGVGCFKRMKSLMTEHLTEQKRVMFHHAGTDVEQSLLKVHIDIQTLMNREVAGVLGRIERNINTVMQRLTENDALVPENEKAAREAMKIALGNVDQTFAKILDTDIEELKASMAGTIVYSRTQVNDTNSASDDEMSIDETVSNVSATDVEMDEAE